MMLPLPHVIEQVEPSHLDDVSPTRPSWFVLQFQPTVHPLAWFDPFLIKKKNSNFKIPKNKNKIKRQTLVVKKKKKKKNIGGIISFILSSWAEIEPSHRATEMKSRANSTLKIRASEPLSRNLSHWAVIWLSQAEI